MNELSQASRPPARPTMIYDGECRFCTVWVQRWKQTTGNAVEYLPQQAEEVPQRFPELDSGALAEAVHLVEPDGRITRGAEAVFRSMAGQVGWPLHFYETLPGFARLSESFYAFVARHRALFAILTRLLWGHSVERPGYQWVRWWFLRGVGVVFLIAFGSLWTQIIGLSGQHGIIPAADYFDTLRQQSAGPLWRRVWSWPTFFWFNASDFLLVAHCAAGVVLSVLLIFDVAPALCALGAWMLYLSLAGAAPLFLGYQWDNLLLEAGLLSVFLAPWKWRPGVKHDPPVSRLMIFLARWLVFRLMFLSGAVKLLSGDATWQNLTGLTCHYETQPLPTALAWYAHQLPLWMQRTSCAILFGLELIVPFLAFLPRRPRIMAFWCFTGFMALIAATGNYTFFNLLTVTLCLALLDDQALAWLMPRRWRETAPGPATGTLWRAQLFAIVGYAIVALTVSLVLCSLTLRVPIPWGPPFTSLYALSAPWRSINSYGLFAVMTTQRPEIVVEGSEDGERWREYEFKWKPGRLDRCPGWVAPHQPRLDWQMWFAALGDLRGNPWLLNFCQRLLEGEESVLKLLETNPFPDKPPRSVRLALYEYQFAVSEGDGRAWWRRELKGLYLPPVSLAARENRVKAE